MERIKFWTLSKCRYVFMYIRIRISGKQFELEDLCKKRGTHNSIFLILMNECLTSGHSAPQIPPVKVFVRVEGRQHAQCLALAVARTHSSLLTHHTRQHHQVKFYFSVGVAHGFYFIYR